MVKLYDGGAYLVNGTEIVPEAEAAKVEALTGKKAEKSEARKGTMAYGIMEAHPCKMWRSRWYDTWFPPSFP